MSDLDVRPFRRDDRVQLTDLVNAHVQAVVPGQRCSVNQVLSQLEREPGEFIVDRWVRERYTLVAEQRGRISAAAHLVRYADGPEVADTLRSAGEIRWALCHPNAPFWPDAEAAGRAVLATAVHVLRRGGARAVLADGALPAPGLYGIPDVWPHVERLLGDAGFAPGDRTEVVLVANLADLTASSVPSLTVRRSVGSSGTRLTGRRDGVEVGYVEVDLLGGDSHAYAAGTGWADVGNLWVEPEHRRRGVGRGLLAEAARWLAQGHVDRLLDYADATDADQLAFARAVGFAELTRTRRGWRLR